MLSDLLTILLPLIAGYLIVINQLSLVKIINQLLSVMVYIILFFMGIGVALIHNLQQSLLTIFHYSATSVLITLTCNFIALLLLHFWSPWHHCHTQQKLPSRLAMVLESLKLSAIIVAGFLFGLTRFSWLDNAHNISKYILIFLLLLIGIHLRNSGIKLRQILLNRRGIMVAVVVSASSLFSGIINALVLNLPLKMGMAMASGYGWYSLSGILLTEAFGPVIGSAAFFNDLAHELIAIMLIPLLMRRNRNAALGLCGATSMDFTLPVLQRSGGTEIIPAAIVHGFLLTVLAPLLMALFSTT